MDILIIDIGCTHLKSIIYRAGSIIDKRVVETPDNASDIMHYASYFANLALQDGFEISGIIPMSFSESVITESLDGDLTLYGVYPDVPQCLRLPYELTGYPNVFKGVLTILRHLKSQNMKLHRALPVSAMVAVQLTGNTLWCMWDHMHASNTGLYGNGKWLDEVNDYSDWIYTRHTGCPFKSVVGNFAGTDIPVFLGGHDSLFAMYPKPFAYISCGTYLTASQPSEFMVEPKEDYWRNVRYVQDVNGVYHRQLCMKSTGKIDRNQIVEIRHFLTTDEVIVFGSYAQEMSEVLYDYAFQTTIVQDQQFIGAGKAAERGVYDRQSIGANAA